MFNLFKKKESNNDLITQWQTYCQSLGLTDGQILGLAYFNAAIPTVLALVNQNDDILKPLSKVVQDIGKASSEEANVLYLYREFYFNASARDKNISPIEVENMPSDFFEGNKYLKHAAANSGMLKNSRLTVLLIQELGNILNDYKIDLKKAFELGHFHSNFLLKTSMLKYAHSIIISNVLPQYIASAIKIIPSPYGLTLQKEVWLFSKILHEVLNDSVSDREFSEWVWYYHNAIFYENKPGSTAIKSEWNLNDSNFESKMIHKIMDTLPSYYQKNQKIGNQRKSIGIKFDKWEDFFPLLNQKMKNEFELESPVTTFLNQGELCNYLAFKFIAVIKTIFEHQKSN
jgi:hypothetical protein